MKHAFAASRLDVRAFAQASGQLAGRDALAHYKRIARECQPGGGDAVVAWSASGELRTDPVGLAQVWLHLKADATVPLPCQRCLDMVDVRLLVDRWFRFVADEANAAAEDDEVEEDLLVLAADFNLQELLEDELVLELPMIARHEICPSTPAMSVQDSEYGVAVAGRPNPFASLARLKSDQGEGGNE